MDSFKHRNRIGLDSALEALKDAPTQSKAMADDLWRYAEICRMTKVMRLIWRPLDLLLPRSKPASSSLGLPAVHFDTASPKITYVTRSGSTDLVATGPEARLLP